MHSSVFSRQKEASETGLAMTVEKFSFWGGPCTSGIEDEHASVFSADVHVLSGGPS